MGADDVGEGPAGILESAGWQLLGVHESVNHVVDAVPFEHLVAQFLGVGCDVADGQCGVLVDEDVELF